MSIPKARYLSASPYMNDAMNLPVEDVEGALNFYQTVMGFSLSSQSGTPMKVAKLVRDTIEIGICENGGDPTEEGCFFEVDDVEVAFAELKANGLEAESPEYRVDTYGDTSFRVFFIVAPDDLCYCLGEKLP